MEPAPTPDPEPRFSDQVDALHHSRLARRIVAVTMGGALVLWRRGRESGCAQLARIWCLRGLRVRCRGSDLP